MINLFNKPTIVPTVAFSDNTLWLINKDTGKSLCKNHDLNDYFMDWKHPTEVETEMFNYVVKPLRGDKLLTMRNATEEHKRFLSRVDHREDMLVILYESFIFDRPLVMHRKNNVSIRHCSFHVLNVSATSSAVNIDECEGLLIIDVNVTGYPP